MGASGVWAADPPKESEKPAPDLTPEIFEGGTNAFSNWIEFGGGSVFTSGSKAMFRQQHQVSGGAFGGISDFHYQTTIATNTTFTADGHAIFDNNDYKLSLEVAKEKVGYVRFSAIEFRTWSDGDGGFYPPTGSYFGLPGGDLALDRGEISLEAGLTLDKVPKVVFKYSHKFREGEKDSTSWGYTHPGGGPDVRGLAPAFWDINEHSDTFQLDVTHHIKATEFGAGLSYETGKLDDALKVSQFPGEVFAQKLTDREGTSYDLFNVHAFTETWLKKNLEFSTGFAFSDLNNDFSGSRIYGSDFDVAYVPNANSSFGYTGLSGGSHLNEYVLDANLLYKPASHLTIIPSIRAQKEDWDADSFATETLGLGTPTPFSSSSSREDLEVRERLDLTFNGVTNWVFYGRGEWTEGDGNFNANGGTVPITIGGFAAGTLPIQQETDDNRFFQKYSLGARWYPARTVTVDAGGYYKLNKYHYDNDVDSTANDSPDRYPAYLIMQDFETYDGNTRLTVRPWKQVSLNTRYEFQYSTIHTQPDPISGLSDVESSKMTSHIIAEDITWTPWSRLFLQFGGNYVLSDTHTPASDVTQAILASRNNYWTLNCASGLVLDDKTDLKVNYLYYHAFDYVDNSINGVPYGSGAREQGVTATVTRRLTKNLRLLLRYGFFHYEDALYGGNRDFDSHLIYSSLQYRF
jgi:hypothetical protein